MSDKKYQIFISSTYQDLKEEREKVVEAILKMEHIPIGMEMFNASDDTSWEIIKRTIELSDYYVLILGFRYGSLTDDGLGFTEKEYDFAVEKGIPIIPFVKEEAAASTPDQRNESRELDEKLNAFRNKVKKKQVGFWKNKDELAYMFTAALSELIRRKPGIGWTRNTIDYEGLTGEMVAISKENRMLRAKVDKLERRTPCLDMCFLDKDDEVIDSMSFPYREPEVETLYRTKLHKSDLFGSLHFVKQSDIDAYNSKLPSESEYAAYNDKNYEYMRKRANAVGLCVEVMNNGNNIATEINVTINFPEALEVYSEHDFEDLEEPEPPQEPSLPGMGYSAGMRLHNGSILNSLTFDRPIEAENYDIGKGTLTWNADKLVHSLTKASDLFYIVPKTCGTFTISVRIICAEMEAPMEKEITVSFS